MGYPSYVSGSAKGKNLVQQLLDQGLQQDGEEIDAPDSCFIPGASWLTTTRSREAKRG